MTDIYMDGFDHYGTGIWPNVSAINFMLGNYAEVPVVGGFNGIGVPSWGPAATGPSCLLRAAGNPNAGSSTCTARYVLPTPAVKLFVSLRYAMDNLPTVPSGNYIFGIRDNSNVEMGRLRVTTTGGIELVDGNENLIAATSGPVLIAHNFHFLEMEWDSSTHTFTLRVDDATAALTPAITTTGLTFGTVYQVSLLPNPNNTSHGVTLSPNATSYMDDLYIRDGTGSVNNSWLGDRRIAWLPVNADSPAQGWTPRFYHEIGTGILNNSATNANYTAAAASPLDLSGDFTLESFVRFDQLPTAAGYQAIFSRWDATNNKRSYQLILGGSSYNSSSLQFNYSTDGTSATMASPIVYPFIPDLNRWYHIAVVRASGELLLFVDGNQLGLPIAESHTYFAGGSEPLSVGIENSFTASPVANTQFVGRLDETRITNGFARYTAPFTPTTVAFGRSVATDPQFNDVVLLCGYEGIIQDESGYFRTLTANNGSVAQLTNDGPAIGNFSTIGKIQPDDHTFMAAAFTAATSILTMTTQPTAGNTVTVGTTDGSTPAVYTFRASVSSAFDVLIDTTAQNTLLNLFNAINAGTGAGTKYGTGTTANFDVFATQLPAGQIEVTANTAGSAGNSIATSKVGTAMSWTGSTLSGGANLPSYAEYKITRPPVNTTLISAIQLVQRMWKTDSGSCSEQGALVGPLGTVQNGTNHGLTTTTVYYNDVMNTDPDTSGAITPATLINGKVRINRTL